MKRKKRQEDKDKFKSPQPTKKTKRTEARK